ncbi:MAG: FHA domain-containing protein, partial [Planctomycetota bacterium]
MVELIGRDRDGRFEVSVPPTGGVLGRGRRAEIRLGHPSISRRHALLEPLGGGRWRITDLGSRNGVTLRSVRVHSGEVCEGESIGLGDLSVQRRGDGDAPAPGIGERARGQSARGRPIEVGRRREALLFEEPVSSGSVSSAPSLRRRLFIPAIACSLLLAAWALPQLSSPGGEESRRGEDPAPISALPSATPDRAASGTARPPPPRADPEAAGSVARVETPPTLLGRWLLLEPGVLEDAWSVSILLLGRAPSPGEGPRFAEGGLDEFLILA